MTRARSSDGKDDMKLMLRSGATSPLAASRTEVTLKYSIERASLLAEQLRQLASRHPHQLAGHAANLDFWVGEVSDSLRALDGYNERFRRMRAAQLAWTRERRTRVRGYCPICKGACELGPSAPPPPERTPIEEIESARAGLRAALRRLLARIDDLELRAEAELRSMAACVGVTLEREDLEG
ncbi:MAG: hypothetical protein JNM94_01370 [Phycisphaerae bacterium]|nr:hypothetical protein [Phycisphaerae bacterium]